MNKHTLVWGGLVAVLLVVVGGYAFLPSLQSENFTKPTPSSSPQASGTPTPEKGNTTKPPEDDFLPEVGDQAGDFVVAEVASSPHGFSVGYAGRTTISGRVLLNEQAGGYCFLVAAKDSGKLPQRAGEEAATQFCFDNQEALPASLKRLQGTQTQTTIEIADYAEEYYGIDVSSTARFVRIVGQ